RRARRQPVLFVLEDLQWADRSSLLLLEFLAPRLRSAAVVLLATYRDLDVIPAPPLYAPLAAVSRHPHTLRLVLRGLEPDALARFVAATAGLLPSAPVVEAMLRDTGGNPFFVSEVVRLLASEGQLERLTADASGPLGVPPSVREVVGQRLARLSPAARDLLDLAATIGVEMPVAVLAGATGRPAMQVLAALEEPLAARLATEVREDPGRWRFTHALVREVLYGAETTAREVAVGIDLSGKVALVTGGSSGLGQETARVLAARGAHVILTARDMPKGEAVAAGIRASTGNQHVEVEELELGSLKHIRAFAQRFLARHPTLHILVNNAGVMACPPAKTADGFELQFGSNHLGHFLTTCLLAPALRQAVPSRVVSVSSRGHHMSPVVFEDIQFERRPYDKWLAYGQ